MSDLSEENPDTDALLVAYLDGELERVERADFEQRLARDAGLRDRLKIMQAGERPFSEAFRLLLDAAPVEKLEAMLIALPNPVRSEVKVAGQSGRWRLAIAAAVVAAFCAGLATAELARTGLRPLLPTENAESPTNWRQVVAEYQALYTPDSVASIPDDSEARHKELDIVGAKLGLGLSPEAVSLPDLRFKHAQLLGYDGAPLGQLTYLDPAGRVVALCIIDNGQPTAPVQQEILEGMAVAHWSKQGRSFMLIGSVPGAELQNLASGVSNRL